MYSINPIYNLLHEQDEEMPEVNMSSIYGTGSVASGVAGEELLRRNWDRLNGTVTRFHNTDKKNVKDIMQNGILAKFSEDPNNITNKVVDDVDMAKKKGLVYTSKDRNLASGVGKQRHNLHLADNNGKNLKLKFNYDDISKLARIENPELRGMTKEQYINSRMNDLRLFLIPEHQRRAVLAQEYDYFKNGTHIFRGDISPEHIVGSKKYKSQIDWKRWKDYVKKHPKRFAKGVGLSLAGLTGLAGAGYLAKKSYDAHKEEASKRH